MPTTVTGVEELVVVPLPRSPTLLSPQHCTVPPERTAQAEVGPTETPVAPVKSAAASPELPPEEDPDPEEESGPLPDDVAASGDDEVERLAPPHPKASKNETPTVLAALRFMAPRVESRD